MRKGDKVAIVYLLALGLLLVIFFDQFVAVTKAQPLIMGFLKFAYLATFGSLLKVRISTGKWTFDLGHVSVQFLVWGVIGVWITAAFPGTNGAVKELNAEHMLPTSSGSFGVFWAAFSRSFCINLGSGFAFWMMLIHEYLERFCIRLLEQHRLLSFVQFGRELDIKTWFQIIPLTITFFWLPAHTLTFLLPSEFRIIFAAVLSVVLGFFLTVGRKKETK